MPRVKKDVTVKEETVDVTNIPAGQAVYVQVIAEKAFELERANRAIAVSSGPQPYAFRNSAFKYTIDGDFTPADKAERLKNLTSTLRNKGLNFTVGIGSEWKPPRGALPVEKTPAELLQEATREKASLSDALKETSSVNAELQSTVEELRARLAVIDNK